MARIIVYEEKPPLLRLAGDEVRATSGGRRRALSKAQTASVEDVVVDLTELRFADASLMLDLAALAKRMRAQGRRLLIRRPQPDIMRLMEMVGLLHLPSVQLTGTV